MEAKKILIADDHFAIRVGIRHLLTNEFVNAEFGEAVDAHEALDKIIELPRAVHQVLLGANTSPSPLLG